MYAWGNEAAIWSRLCWSFHFKLRHLYFILLSMESQWVTALADDELMQESLCPSSLPLPKEIASSNWSKWSRKLQAHHPSSGQCWRAIPDLELPERSAESFVKCNYTPTSPSSQSSLFSFPFVSQIVIPRAPLINPQHANVHLRVKSNQSQKQWWGWGFKVGWYHSPTS